LRLYESDVGIFKTLKGINRKWDYSTFAIDSENGIFVEN
jgi:hypothetical protein